MRDSPLFHPCLLLLLVATASVVADSGAIWATPHASYSSSAGVLGCKIDTNRVAYFPEAVDCTNICVSVSYGGRSVYLLRIDQSGGAHDMSYDAWNYLMTGESATKRPTAGGAVSMHFEDVHAQRCAGLVHTEGSKLPLSAANSMNFLASCLAQEDSWVARNHVLYNVLDPICSLGYDEVCSLDWPAANQATCPHALGIPAALTTDPVYNVEYPTGRVVSASSGEVVGDATSAAGAKVDFFSLGWLAVYLALLRFVVHW